MRFRKSDAKEFASASPVDTSGVFTSNFRLQPPEGWQLKDSVTLINPSGQANIVASSNWAIDSWNLRDTADDADRRSRAEFANDRELSRKSVTSWNGVPGVERVFSWQSSGDSVTQIQRHFMTDNRQITLTATSHSENFDRFETELRSVLQRFSVGG